MVNKNAIKYLGGPFFGDKTNIFENLIYYEIRFGIIGFGSVNHTEISVSVISVFTRFGRPLLSGSGRVRVVNVGFRAGFGFDFGV